MHLRYYLTLWGLCLATALAGQPDLCLSFECGDLQELGRYGFTFSRGGEGVSLDSSRAAHGGVSLKLRQQEVDSTGPWLYFSQSIPAHLLVDQSVELSARVMADMHGAVDTMGPQIGLVVFGEEGEELLRLTSVSEAIATDDEAWMSRSIEAHIPAGATKVFVAGFVSEVGSAWFDDFRLLIDGRPYLSGQDVSRSEDLLPTRPEVEWLRQYVHPLRSADPQDVSFDDLAAFGDAIGTSHVVGLGESTHGSREIFQLRDRLYHYLQREKDFNIFAMEADLVDLTTVDAYIHGAEVDSVTLLQRLGSPPWYTQEVLDLLSGLRQRATVGSSIVGIDVQFFRPAYEELNGEFGGEYPEVFRRLYDVLGILHTEQGEPAPRYVKEVDEHLGVLRQAIDAGAYSTERAGWLHHMVRLLAMRLHTDSASRDRHMAENVRWWLDREPQSKLAIWAHNEHIKTVAPWMGSHLRDTLGENYTAVGCTFYEGNYSAGTSARLEPVEAQRGYAGTYEAVFAAVGEPLFFLDLREIAQDTSPYAAWFRQHVGFRRVGLMQPALEFGEEDLPTAYDIMMFIRRSTPTQTIRLSY